MAWVLPAGVPLAAQVTGTLAGSASIVEYDGFLSSGAVVLAPALRFDSSRLSLAGQGSWTRFESGNGVVQGNAAAAWMAGGSGALRLEFSGAAGASRYADQPTTGHALAGARLHAFRRSVGGWVGVTTGRTWGGTTGGTPLEVVLAGWTAQDRLAVVGSVTFTRRGNQQYSDILGAVRWTGTLLELEARLGARPWARTPGAVGDAITGGFGEIMASRPLGDRLAVSLSAGSYPSDPVRRVLGAKYLSAGVRLQPFGRAAASVPVHTTGVLRGRTVPSSGSAVRLDIEGFPSARTLRVHAPNASSVEITGDFTDWTPVSLAPVGTDRWELQLALPPGVYRVNVRVNGGPWVVPAGLRQEATEFGGAVGVLVVP